MSAAAAYRTNRVKRMLTEAGIAARVRTVGTAQASGSAPVITMVCFKSRAAADEFYDAALAALAPLGRTFGPGFMRDLNMPMLGVEWDESR